MLHINEILDAYTISTALCLRARFFFNDLLKASNTPAETSAIHLARENFTKRDFRVDSLRSTFRKEVYNDALRSSTAMCVSLSSGKEVQRGREFGSV